LPILSVVSAEFASSPYLDPSQWTSRDWFALGLALALTALGSVALAVRYWSLVVRHWRWIPGALLLIVGVVGFVFGAVVSDPTAVSIWIGVGASGVVSGLVDLSGLVERER